MSNLTQLGFRFGANPTEESNPDVILYIDVNENAIGNYINNQLHIRIQVTNESSITGTQDWQLYYNTVNDPANATKVTTGTSVVKIVDDTNIADGTALINQTAIDVPGGFLWQDGEYTETTDADLLDLGEDFYTDFQWCIQFDNTAELGIPYYFYLRINSTVLDTYPATADLPTAILATEKVRYVNTDVSPGGDGSIEDPYASLNEWEAAEQDDLRPFYIPSKVFCSGSIPDTAPVDIIGWITSVTDGIFIIGDENLGGRHTGIEGTGYVLQPSAGSNALRVQESYTTIDGIEVFDIGGNYTVAIIDMVLTAITEVTFKNMIIHGVYNVTGMGMRLNTSGTTYTYNNIIYDISYPTSFGAIRTHNGTHYIYNNTIARSGWQGIRQITGTTIVKNNLIVNCVDDCYFTNTSFDADSDYNASDDATSTDGDNDRINQEFTFVDVDNNDYHLAADDTGARGKGKDLSTGDPYLNFTTDIDGTTRTEPWDIGADEIAPVFYVQRKKDDGEWEIVGYASDGDSTITIDNNWTELGDGIYQYRLYLISECDVTSEASDIYTLEVENETIVTIPANDITDLRVETNINGTFEIFWKYEHSVPQTPTVFNIYSFVIANPSQDPNPSDYDPWILDGQLAYSPTYAFFTYTSQSYTHGSEVAFKVIPTIEVGSIEFERENLITDSAESDAEGPIPTTDFQDINLA